MRPTTPRWPPARRVGVRCARRPAGAGPCRAAQPPARPRHAASGRERRFRRRRCGAGHAGRVGAGASARTRPRRPPWRAHPRAGGLRDLAGRACWRNCAPSSRPVTASVVRRRGAHAQVVLGQCRRAGAVGLLRRRSSAACAAARAGDLHADVAAPGDRGRSRAARGWALCCGPDAAPPMTPAAPLRRRRPAKSSPRCCSSTTTRSTCC